MVAYPCNYKHIHVTAHLAVFLVIKIILDNSSEAAVLTIFSFFKLK